VSERERGKGERDPQTDKLNKWLKGESLAKTEKVVVSFFEGGVNETPMEVK